MTAEDQERALDAQFRQADIDHRTDLYDCETDSERVALDALLAENQRLRDALERIATWPLERTRFEAEKFAREELAGDAE